MSTFAWQPIVQISIVAPLQPNHSRCAASAPNMSIRSSAETAPPAAAATFSLQSRTLSVGSASISSSCTAPLRMMLPNPTCTWTFTCGRIKDEGVRGRCLPVRCGGRCHVAAALPPSCAASLTLTSCLNK